MPTPRRWTVAPAAPAAEELGYRLKISPLLAQILADRGFVEPDAAAAFLSPNLRNLHDPSLLAGLGKASARVARAIAEREKIVIFGDYDVDGITAVSILWHAIQLLGGDVHYYIPHRIDEGYGLNTEAIAQIIADGAKLIITVDCGVTAAAPANVAKDAGVDLIITDHHEWHVDAAGQPELPPAFAIVHPRLPGENGAVYPNPHLCGAGVAFKLAWGIGKAVAGADRVGEALRGFLIEATALAALGTIADVVPLVGENRILAHFGLGGLTQSQVTGIVALIESAGLAGKQLDSFHVGFLLGPRLNACGRMGHAALAVEMLTVATPERAMEIAAFLESQNRERQATEKQIVEAAVAQIIANGWAADDRFGIVLADAGWHAGVIGIVASRLVERFNRPTVMIALHPDGRGQGSARSIAGFHLADAFTECTEHLLGHGGHEMAAGLKIDAACVEAFREAFCAVAAKSLTPDDLIPRLQLDALAELPQINGALVADLARLGPFGQGNRKPLFGCRGLTVALPPRRVGRASEHLQLTLRQGGVTMKAIAFNHGDWADRLQPGTVIDLAAEPTLNVFNGRTSVELLVKDLQMAEAASPAREVAIGV